MSEKKKKKTTFRKKEDGLVLESDDGKTLAVGLPIEVERVKSGEGKAGIFKTGIGGEAKGESYLHVKYKWHLLPTEKEELTEKQIENISADIATTSGTVPVGYTTYELSREYKVCDKCGTSNPVKARYCLNCGSLFIGLGAQ